METRSVVDRISDGFEHGHREERRDASCPWQPSLHGEYVRSVGTFWFQRTPQAIMREDMGFETTHERASEFSGASDSNPDLWFHLAASSPRGTGDEALKWIMGALAAEVKLRGQRFRDIPSLMPARHLALFVQAISDGTVDRTMAKAVFAALLDLPRSTDAAATAEAFAALVGRPEFRAVSADDLAPIVERIISENPDQFDKARENPKLVQWFVGQTMKATGGKASASVVIAIVNGRLAG